MSSTGRLTTSADFRRIYAEGTRASAGSVTAHVRVDSDARPARVGVTAARGLGGAVQRNRAKRRLREAVRPLLTELQPGADVVLVASPDTLHIGFQNLADSVRSAIATAGGCR